VSEEVGYDVEGGPGPADTAPVEQPVAEAAAPEPEAAPDTGEAEAVDVGGQRMVPLAALHTVREQNRTLRQKADQYDQIASEWNNARPYVEFLKNNPDLLKPREAQTPAAAPAPPEADPALVNLAKTLDLYTPEGLPDARRASAIRDMVKTEAQSIAQQTVKPFEEQSIHERAQSKFREALAVDMNGIKPNPQVLAHIWKTTDPRVLATDQGAGAAVLMAMGLSAVSQQPGAPAVTPPATTPVVTEPAGGRNMNRPAISEFEQRVIKVRGLDAKRYGEATRGFKPGEVNILED
jgi:hypothetical protein